MSGTSYGCMFKKEYEDMAFFTLEENKHMAAEIEVLYCCRLSFHIMDWLLTDARRNFTVIFYLMAI